MKKSTNLRVRKGAESDITSWAQRYSHNSHLNHLHSQYRRLLPRPCQGPYELGSLLHLRDGGFPSCDLASYKIPDAVIMKQHCRIYIYSITRAEEPHRSRSCKVGAISRIFIVIEYGYVYEDLMPLTPHLLYPIPTPTRSITNTQPNSSPTPSPTNSNVKQQTRHIDR